MAELIHDEYRCEGFYGFGSGVELHRLGEHADGATLYCGRCPLAEPCWFRHRGRIMWLLPALSAQTIAYHRKARTDDPDALPGEPQTDEDPFVGALGANLEDGARVAAGQLPKDRGPLSIDVDEYGRPFLGNARGYYGGDVDG